MTVLSWGSFLISFMLDDSIIIPIYLPYLLTLAITLPSSGIVFRTVFDPSFSNTDARAIALYWVLQAASLFVIQTHVLQAASYIEQYLNEPEIDQVESNIETDTADDDIEEEKDASSSTIGF